jgi:hypothetical protein
MYHLDVSRSFIERASILPEMHVIDRIKKAYLKARQDQLVVENVYQVSREWLPIYSAYMGSAITTLSDGSLGEILAMYSNFFRHPCSTGLHGLHFSMVERYMSGEPSPEDKKAYLENIAAYARLFLLNCQNRSPAVLARPSVGNPYGYEIIEPSGVRHFISPCSEYHYYYADRIQMLLESSRAGRVLELGGGFGGMASYLLRDYQLNLYLAFDLPENVALQSYFLMTLFPNKRFGLYGEFDVQNLAEASKQFDVLLLPNYAIENVPEDFVSLSYNSYSLAEMSLDSISRYLELIAKVTSRYIYHVNHVHWPVSADNFKIDADKFDLFLRFPTMWGRDPVHPKIDHHDYIYKRRPS